MTQRSHIRLAVLGTLGLAMIAQRGLGQCAGRWITETSSPGFDGPIRAMAVLHDGDLVVAGSFRNFASITSNGLCCSIGRYNPRTRVWSALPRLSGNVHALTVLADGSLLAGGDFNAPPGQSRYIARIDLSVASPQWTYFAPGLMQAVYSVGQMGDGSIIAGGAFDFFESRAVARYTTGAWSQLGCNNLPEGGPVGQVSALQTLPDGSIIAAGMFSNVCTSLTTRPAVGRWDGTRWSRVGPLLSGASTSCSSLLLARDGSLYVGGSASVGNNNYCALKWDGTSWSGFGVSASQVLALAQLDSGAIVLAGSIGRIAGNVFPINIAMFDGGTWSSLGGGASPGPVYALKVLPNGDLAVGGSFTTVGSEPTNNFAIWTTLQPCVADFNCSTYAEAADIFEFLNAWFLGQARSNVDGIGGITVQDIFAFLDAWFAGCP